MQFSIHSLNTEKRLKLAPDYISYYPYAFPLFNFQLFIGQNQL